MLTQKYQIHQNNSTQKCRMDTQSTNKLSSPPPPPPPHTHTHTHLDLTSQLQKKFVGSLVSCTLLRPRRDLEQLLHILMISWNSEMARDVTPEEIEEKEERPLLSCRRSLTWSFGPQAKGVRILEAFAEESESAAKGISWVRKKSARHMTLLGGTLPKNEYF